MFRAEIVIYIKYYSLRIPNDNIASTNTQQLYYERKLHTCLKYVGLIFLSLRESS